MNVPEFMGSRTGIYGIGVLAFGVIALASLLTITSGGEHPLTLESDIDLCELLGEDVWLKLQYAASDTIARLPEESQDDPAVCALELDPVAPEDRWARIARGDDADRVRRIATATITSTAILRGISPGTSSQEYAVIFDKELVASGWVGQDIEGSWSWAKVYSQGDNEAGALVEDDGVILWVVATDIAPENMILFARMATENVRLNAAQHD